MKATPACFFVDPICRPLIQGRHVPEAPSTLSLRPATEADVIILVHVARQSWLSAFEGSAPPAFVTRWRTKDSEPAWYARYWPDMTVADLDGTPTGLVQPAEDEVNGLWVLPDAQGNGVGSALLLEAERQIAAAGHERAWLTCSGFNPRALAFYRGANRKSWSPASSTIPSSSSGRWPTSRPISN